VRWLVPRRVPGLQLRRLVPSEVGGTLRASPRSTDFFDFLGQDTIFCGMRRDYLRHRYQVGVFANTSPIRTEHEKED